LACSGWKRFLPHAEFAGAKGREQAVALRKFGALIEEVRFARDSPLEEARFEPSVPRGATEVSSGHITSARFHAAGNVGRSENRNDEIARCLQQDRWFESISLRCDIKNYLIFTAR
jgi:hypothetical protein